MAARIRRTERDSAPLTTEPTTTADDPEVIVVEKGATPPSSTPPDAQAVYERERAEYGGIKFGSAFFGWLTATGLIAILSAIAGFITAAFEVDVDDVGFGAALTAAIVLLVILFVSYLAGGYVAGRMARFAGAKQGVAVWVWGVLVTVVLVVVAAVAGARYDILDRAGLLPQVGFGEDQIVASVLTLVGAAAAALVGAILGGILGMRFHRRVDRAGWTQPVS